MFDVPKVDANPKMKRVSKSKKSGIVFPVVRFLKKLKNAYPKQRVGKGAAVYLAAVLEYLVGEVTELSAGNAHKYKKSRITPRHVQLAIRNDEELDQLLSKAILPSGGVIPYIHPKLLPRDNAPVRGRRAPKRGKAPGPQ